MKDDTISRKAAIEAIVNTVSEIGLHDNSEVARYGATFMQHEIIDIIEGMPSAQPKSYREGYQAGFKDAQSERKRGRWIYGEDNLGTGRDGWFCSECGHFELWDYSADMKSAELNLPNYCPNCGADMREVSK